MLYVNYSFDQLQGPLDNRPKPVRKSISQFTHKKPPQLQGDVLIPLQDMWNTYLLFLSMQD